MSFAVKTASQWREMNSKPYLSTILAISAACIFFSFFLIEKSKRDAAQIKLEALSDKFEEMKTQTDAERAALLAEIETLNNAFMQERRETQKAHDDYETRLEKIHTSDSNDWLACTVPDDVRELFMQIGQCSD